MNIHKTSESTERPDDLAASKFYSYMFTFFVPQLDILAMACDFQQCGFLTSVDSNELVQPPLKLRNPE